MIDGMGFDAQLEREIERQTNQCRESARAGNVKEFIKQFRVLLGQAHLEERLAKLSTEERYKAQGRVEGIERCVELLTDIQNTKEG